MDRISLVYFEDHSEYVLFVKKLKVECFVIDLLCFPVGEACYLHRLSVGKVGRAYARRWVEKYLFLLSIGGRLEWW